VHPVAVVIPAYNEAATVAEVVQAACAASRLVIVVDDGSEDDTVRRLDGLPVAVLRNGRNCGKGASLWRGMRHAVTLGAEAVVTLDADGQHAPQLIPRLVAAHRDHPDRLIVAARLLCRERMPKNRRFGNEVADFWIGWAAGCPVADSQSGFRLYPAALVNTLRVDPGRGQSFVFESEVLIQAARCGFRPLAVPIEAIYGTNARASYYRPWRDTIRIVAMVAGKLVSRGMAPIGLIRSRRSPVAVYTQAEGAGSTTAGGAGGAAGSG
jgi:glycosyltransferase involved in cell wall biosynthesis